MKNFTPNHPGGNGKPNGKGVGDLPGRAKGGASNRSVMKARENTDPMKKDDKVERVVGE